MRVKYADRRKNTISLTGSIYIIETFMEKGIPREESSIDPHWMMHRDIQDAKKGLMTFDELRQVWLAWAKHAIQDMESHT